MLETVIYPLFEYSILLGIAAISIVITIITTITTKYVTDQDSIRKIKKDIKNLNKELRNVSDDKQKAQSIQSRLWPKQKKLMKESFTPMLYYGIPLFLIFAWLGATLGQAPINPGDEFTITAHHTEDIDQLEIQSEVINAQRNDLYSSDTPQTQWIATSETVGEHTFTISPPNTTNSVDHTVTITDTYGYNTPTKTYDDSKISQVTVQYGKVTPFGDFDILGWQPGWLATYILFGLLSNVTLRKILNVA